MTSKLGLLLVMAALGQTLSAQPSSPASQLFLDAVSYHVPEESRIQYETWLKNKFRPFAEALMKEDTSLKYIIATRVIFGGVKEPEANTFVTYAIEGYPKAPTATANKVTKQLFGKSYEEFVSEARAYRHHLGQTLAARMFGTPLDVAEGDLIRLDYKRVTPGRMGDYVQLERDYLRLREAQVKAGSMKGWSMSTLVLPGGTERDFDAFTVHVGKDLEQLMTWGRGTMDLAAKLDPPVNMIGAALRADSIEKTIRAETRVVTLIVRSPTT